MFDPATKALVQGAMIAGSMALNMTRKIEGPRLDSTKFSGGDYGAALELVWGKRRGEKPIFWAEDMKEIKQTRKTKGGKYNDYSYYGTWAVALAGHEISGVTRMWLDTHLVLDLTGAGPVTPFDFGSSAVGKGSGSAGAGGFAINDHFALYYGTEDQEPDPRMQATIEAKHGEGSCPAYRGTAYVVFKDLPLEKFGNRIPQFAGEVVSSSTAVYPFETFETIASQPNRLWGFTFSSDYSRFMWGALTTYEIWDTAARSRMIAGAWPEEMTLQAVYGLYNSGTILAVGDITPSSGPQHIYQLSPDGTAAASILSLSDFTHRQEGVRVIADGNGTEHWFTVPWSSNTRFYSDGEPSTMLALTGATWKPMGYFPDSLGNIWAFGRATTTSATTAHFYRVVTVQAEGPGYIVVPGLAAIGSALGDIAACYADGALVLAWNTIANDDQLYRISAADGSILASRTGLFFDEYNMEKQFANLPPGSQSIWLNYSGTVREISLSTLGTIRTVTLSNWLAAGASGLIYEPRNHALITAPFSDKEISFRYLDRLAGAGVPLSTIAGDVADMAGVQDYDFSALTQIVPGWSATKGQASNMLEPLLDAYDSDIRPHDFTLQGVKRTGTSGGTILTERFVAADPRYSVKVRQSAELPQTVIVTFADVDADQQPNTARADRPLDATGAKGKLPIDMGTWATDVDQAKQLFDRYHRRIWNDRRELSNALTAQHLSLEPGDCRTLDLDGESDIYRLTRLTVKANGELATDWKYDHPSIAGLDGTSGANFDGHKPSVIIVPIISKGFFLDIPLIQDVDDQPSPVVYIAAAPYATGSWPGAVMYQSIDGEYSDEIGSVTSSAPATWGYATALPSYADPDAWDLVSSITVTPQYGSLTGTTEAAIDANPMLNLAAIGGPGRWEIVNFTTATLEADGTYTVSGFKRGRRGTEWAAELHAASDQFVLLETAQDVALGLSEVGTDLSFKAVTNGRTADGAFAIPVAPFTGASLKPYAPIDLDGVKEANDDWTLTWTRRTRVGAENTPLPLSEASEEYEVEIMDGSTVVRTITGLSSPTATYTEAQQITDFGVDLATVTFRVYQISDAVGRGFARQATVEAASGDPYAAIYVGGTTHTQIADGSTATTVDLTSLTGGLDTAPSPGDIVIYTYGRAGASSVGTPAVPSGFYLIHNSTGTDIYDARLVAGAATMGASPPTSIAFGTPATGQTIAISVRVWRELAAFEGVQTATGSNNGQPNPPSITTTPGRLISCGGAAADQASAMSAPTSGDLEKFESLRRDGGASNTTVGFGAGVAIASGSSFDAAQFGGGSSSGNSSWAAHAMAFAIDDGTLTPTGGSLQTSSSTTMSTSAYASKGTIMWALAAGEVDSVDVYIAPSGTETYKVVVARLNPDDTIAAIIGSSSPANISTTANHNFALTSPATIAPFEKIAFIAVRTDGTSTAVARVAFPAATGASNAQWTFYGSVRYASNDPQVSDAVLYQTTSAVRLTVNYDYLA